MPSVLIVVAHPDDEVLGVGATAAGLAAKGFSVRSCILSGAADARHNRPGLPELTNDIYRAQETLQLGEPILGDFPNIRFNTVPHIELVQFIELAIGETQANIIFTHHPGDLNSDHQHTSMACQAASRFFQRQHGRVPQLQALFFMEILSSTDWSFPGTQYSFSADTFYPAENTLDLKIEALQAYSGVMRDFPHPRSPEIVKSLAAYRGGQSGLPYAEAFQTAFRILRIS